ncbi:MAG: PEGA domain-containing protein [Deltaproteobacteria bacterium]|nr:PEGA domain-containing protein [Deltaproteobacteria bacterium]
MKRLIPMLVLASITFPLTARGKPTVQPTPATSLERVATPSPIQVDPFARLKRVIPREALKPIRSVRLYDQEQEVAQSPKDKIKVIIQTRPRGALVKWGRRTLGNTPVALIAPRGSTPADLVIRRKGYMVLRTRVQRRTSRSYFFKLTPAKFH